VLTASSLFLAASAIVAEVALGRGTIAQPAAQSPPPAVARLFSIVRPEYSGDKALATVAFVEQRWRWPGNRGFEESIDHIIGELKRAGFVDETAAGPTDRLTFRIDARPMTNAAWEPIDASLTIGGASTPVLQFATNRNMLAVNSSSTPAGGVEAEVVSVGKGDAASLDRVSLAGKIAFGEMPVGRLFTEARRRGAIGVLP
jgi:aminopeptidase YwaD